MAPSLTMRQNPIVASPSYTPTTRVASVEQLHDRLAGAARGPVRLVAEVPVDDVDVDARLVVVELDPAGERAPHQQVVPSRRWRSAGSVSRIRRSSVRSRSANHTPSPSPGARVRTRPHGSTTIEFP